MCSTWTYILASKPRGTLYIGVTNGLIQRIEQHRAGTGSAFTRRYGVHTLVWYEEFATARHAIQREKSLKHYTRAWKVNLIERTNPHWLDLYRDAARCGARSCAGPPAEPWILGPRPRMTVECAATAVTNVMVGLGPSIHRVTNSAGMTVERTASEMLRQTLN
jgi:putative endonuclease